MEIGTFFEVYEVDNREFQIGKAKEISELLNIQLTRKNKTILENTKKNPLMAGVPAVAMERYLNRLISEEKYTIVVVRQKGVPPKLSRYIDTIISPGTNFDFVKSKEENFLTSLFVDINRGIYSIAISAIDVTTGKTYLLESHSSSSDKTYALDEAFHFLSTHKTKEVVLSTVSNEVDEHEVVRYLELDTHYNYVLNKSRFKLNYQNELFSEVYRIESMLSPIEFLNLERSPLLSENLAILIDFIIGHDSNIVQKLAFPKRLSSNRYLYFGNNASEQLGIISKDKEEFTLLKLLDLTTTSMGKRLLKERILHPIMERDELIRRYNLSKQVNPQIDLLQLELKRIYDLERLSRRMALGRLHPCEVNYLHSSLLGIKEMTATFNDICSDLILFNPVHIKMFIDDIERLFNLELSAKFNYNQIDENIFNSGSDAAIDLLVLENEKLYSSLYAICDRISALLFKVSGKSDKIGVILGQLDKEGHYLSLTRNRFSQIEEDIKKERLILNGKEIFFEDFNYKKQTSNVKITADIIDDISRLIVNNQQKIVALVKEKFGEIQHRFEQDYSVLLDALTLFVADIDVATTNMQLSKKYNYSEPIIVETREHQNFLERIELRHPLIEVKEESGIFVPNDIILGDKTKIDPAHYENVFQEANIGKEVKGVLLYGINSSGKSSLMKSIGIAVIMAQAGLFVPATSMRFSLFDALFTRIVSKDNLAKGLSTFAVEMLELKNIFNRATPKSLVLEDEISHGTETLSGVAIVSSAIMKLSKIGSQFVFATHLHQLTNIDEVKKLNEVINLHLAVNYDKKSDKLLFNRKLSVGSGSSLYGLEFAKWLHMDPEFLSNANIIRKKIADDYDSVERVTHKKRSKYNKNVYISKCSICDDAAVDVHHIKEQHEADERGFTGHFHKNHRFNLIPLCKKHHDAIHAGDINVEGFIMTERGLELRFSE
jgi:DNA mismatch repair protein MutS